MLFAYSDDLPEVSALDNYKPNTITRVLGKDGQVVGEFAVERRVVVHYDDIPVNLRQAILAAEDGGFFQHAGLSISRMMLALARDIFSRGNVPGGSTLTQQLARNLFPKTIGFDRTWERKIKEALVSIQIEKRYSKPEIFTLYCNQIYFGHGAYGVEAASQLYFRKHVKDLALEEAAMIAGIIQANVRQSPYVNPDAALRRRNYALDRMATEGFITADEAAAAKAKPIVVAGDPSGDGSQAPYFLEEVRKYLEAKYGAKALYESGLTVSTPLDLQVQQAANRALDRGLRRIDKHRGVFRKPARNVLAEKHTLDGFRHDRWSRPIAAGDIVPAVVMAVNDTDRDRACRTLHGRAEQGRHPVDPQDRAVRHPQDRRPDRGRADHTRRRRRQRGDEAGAGADSRGRARRPRQPHGRGPRHGRRLQLRAQQVQPRDAGVPADGLDREAVPLHRGHRSRADAHHPPRRLTHLVRCRRRPARVHAGQLRSQVPGHHDVAPCARTVAQHPGGEGHRHARARPGGGLRRSDSGSASRSGPSCRWRSARRKSRLIELTSAYSAFPNHGIRMAPFSVMSITDRGGTLLEESRPTPRDAIRADTAYVMTSLLRGVVQRGTGAAANVLNWPVAGKTGTVDDYTDAWFVGFDPNVTVGVWVGHDEKKPIGPGETGTTAALPIWIDFMQAYLDLRADREHPPAFEPPGNIVFMAVDRATGEPALDGAANAVTEAFLSGTQPIRDLRD